MAIQAQFYSENLDGFALSGVNQDSLMENACGFDNFCLVPEQQQQRQQHSTQFDQYLVGNNMNDHHQQPQSMAFSQTFSAHFEKQRLEFEQFINLQNERLRLAMREQGKQQTALLMKKYESKTRFLLKQKEEEIAKAANRTMELQNFLKRIEIENQAWQRAARENEAAVASLNGTIQRLRESATLSANAAGDAESCCEERENGGERKRDMVCRCCNSRDSCVVLLPCRHLCSCKDCEVFLDWCPVCRTAKKASIEAII